MQFSSTVRGIFKSLASRNFLGTFPVYLPHPACQRGAPVKKTVFGRNLQNVLPRKLSVTNPVYSMVQPAN